MKLFIWLSIFAIIASGDILLAIPSIIGFYIGYKSNKFTK